MDLSVGQILFILILIALIVIYITKGLLWMSIALAAILIYVIPGYIIIKKIYNFFKKE